jgi:hypothetical protein
MLFYPIQVHHAPKMVTRDSAASRKSVVAMALSFSASMGTSTKDFLKVWTMVPPGGITGADMAAMIQLEWVLAD